MCFIHTSAYIQVVLGSNRPLILNDTLPAISIEFIAILRDLM